jgi:hypothetical protein
MVFAYCEHRISKYRPKHVTSFHRVEEWASEPNSTVEMNEDWVYIVDDKELKYHKTKFDG